MESNKHSLKKDNNNLLKTNISKVMPNEIITRGYSQKELISKMSFSSMIFLMLKGKLPTKKENRVFNHVLVSFADHGVTPPSTQSSRLIASSGSEINVAVAGGLLSFGKNHAGAIEKAMYLYQNEISKLRLVGHSEIDNKFIVESALKLVNSFLNKNEKIPGFGHRYHKKDPRAEELIRLMIKEGQVGPHLKLALSIEKILTDRKGIYLNVDGANAAILSDLGFSSKLGLGIFMIGRLPGLIAHVYEEYEEEDFRKFIDIDDIIYEDD